MFFLLAKISLSIRLLSICTSQSIFVYFKGGFGEGHMSSDEEDMPDDADATDARKKARQGDDDFGEEMSDEEVDLAKVKWKIFFKRLPGFDPITFSENSNHGQESLLEM